MSELEPTVSIVIPHWNNIDILSECLESISSTDFSNLEIIIVDNASSDNSVQWIKTNYPSILFVATISIGCQTQSIEAQAAGITLVRDGIPRAIIAIARDPDEHEQLAVKELQINLEKISDAKVEAVTIKIEGAK